MALIRCHTRHGGSGRTRAGQTRIILRAGIAVGARRAIGGIGVYRTRSGIARARFGDVASIGCSTTNRTGRFELACGRTTITIRRIAVIAGFARAQDTVPANVCRTSGNGNVINGQTGVLATSIAVEVELDFDLFARK